MAQIDKIALVHPVRKRAIECGIISACASCEYSQYQSDSVQAPLKFRGCSVVLGVTEEPKKCSDFCIELIGLENEEREYYEKNGICWD
ncbi:hypothetical protein [Rheinheimera baltica]|uniref:hypothetical protein n=1 Tax=Rheinheimera baltica TaxID=67576 RepID=UPI0012EC3829|nr:hypothetical protein [Rheinheimera baltica]